jgi:hypothetical protein
MHGTFNPTGRPGEVESLSSKITNHNVRYVHSEDTDSSHLRAVPSGHRIAAAVLCEMDGIKPDTVVLWVHA